MASVAWDLLATHLVGGASDPVLGVLAKVAEYVFVHLGARGKVDLAHHALF